MGTLNALTVDVEDYFHVTAFASTIRREDWESYPCRVQRNTMRLLEIFAEREVQGTFFVLGWVAERFPSLVREISRAGHLVGCHGYSHAVIYAGSKEDFRNDLRRARDLLENLLGSSVKSYRAPSYSITSKSLWALEILGEEGFEYDSSIFPVVHDHYGIPGAPRFPYLKVLNCGRKIKEFPPSTFRLLGWNVPIGGGGYLRLLPFELTCWAIRRINHLERQPAMVYLHPWELDPDQPRIPAPWVSRFRHYQNLDSTETKLRRLLTRFTFGSMEKALAGSLADVN
jgi:polysaccharide deacetylase family protein (PEP-CTERM system associated)